MSEGLVYIGKIIALEPIVGADFIVSATVICGKGGKWRGIVGKTQFQLEDLCIVYLPDAQIPPNEAMPFMEKHKWRVRMCRFKGAASEVLIMPYSGPEKIGKDMTPWCGVTKYSKPIPANLQGKALGPFPSFIPKTDEPNFQNSEGQEGIEKLIGQSFYITEKADGSSTTAYKYEGHFGICSRNWELEQDESNGFCKLAILNNLESKLPIGYAIQWETCGPKIQSNPMGLSDIKGFAFSVYDIINQRYLEYDEFLKFCYDLNFPTVKIISIGVSFSPENLDTLGEGTYANGHEREGVVVRSMKNLYGHKPVSFKVINLNYEK